MKGRKPKTKSRRRAYVVEDFLIGAPATKMIAVAATVTAFLYLIGVFKPILDTDPPPLAGKAQVDEKLKPINEAVKETLETAKAASATAQTALAAAKEAVTDSKAARLQRLTQQSVQIQALVDMDPANITFKQLLKQTEADIANLTAEIRPTTPPPVK